MNRERIISVVGYGAFFWFMFWLFAYWTFPYDRLAAFITDKVAESGSGYTLEIGSLSPHWLTGVELEEVKVQKSAAATLAAPTDDKGKPLPTPALRIDQAHARIGLLGLLFGSRSLSFDAEIGDGEIEGRYKESSDEKHIEATIENVDMAKLGLLESFVTLPMKGNMNGEIDLTLGEVPAKTSGSVKIDVKNLTIGDGKAKFKLGSMGGLTIDPIAAGEVNLLVDVKEGVGNIKKLTTSGPDLKLEGSGDIRFAQPIARSRLGVLMKLKLTDTYKNKTARTKTMFSLLEGSSVPQVAAAKTADGAYQLRLGGTLKSVRALPAGQQSLGAPGVGAPIVAAPGDEEE